MKRLFKTHFLFALVIMGKVFSAHADPVSCVLLEESWRVQYVREMKISFPEGAAFSCKHEALLALSLYDLETVKFEADEKGQTPGFYKILKNSQQGLKDQQNLQGSCKTALAFARDSDRTIHICPAFYKDNRIDRASTLMHESRHLSKYDTSHVICKGGKHQGVMACDQKFMNGKRLGSGYNADVNYLGNVVNKQIGTSLSRAIAQSYINYYLGDSFNEITGAQIREWRKDPEVMRAAELPAMPALQIPTVVIRPDPSSPAAPVSSESESQNSHETDHQEEAP